MTFEDFYSSEWEKEQLEFQSKFQWLDEWPQEDELEF